MKKLRILTTLSILAFTLNSYSQSYQFQGKDLTPVVKDVEKLIQVVQKPMMVYHWYGNGTGPTSASDANLIEMVRQKGASFWPNFGKDDRGNVLGVGLYTSLDPIATQSYGGKEWGLVQIQIPVGARLLQFKDFPFETPLSQESLQILNDVGCSYFKGDIHLVQQTRDSSTGKYFTNSPECWKNLEFVLESVKIDGLIYNYPVSQFVNCEDKSKRSLALVLVNPQWMNASNVKVFNKRTVDSNKDRIQITSLFYKLIADMSSDPTVFGANSNTQRDLATAFVESKYPGYYSTGGSSSEGMEICPRKSSTGCKYVPGYTFTPQAYPAVIEASHFPMSYTSLPQELMWTDLDGQPTDPQISDWIRENIYACGARHLRPLISQ